MFDESLSVLNFPEKVAIAVSGGPDSMSVLYHMHLYAKQFPTVLHVLTVNHNLRCEAQEEALLVSSWAKELGIAHTILRWDHDGVVSDIQNKAREARYSLMTTWCKNNGFSVLVLGHHLIDQIETFFMRLRKGSSLKGLCCMQTVTSYNDIKLMRPFLKMLPDDLHKILPRERCIFDPSNEEKKFERVRMRVLAKEFASLDTQNNFSKTLEKLKEIEDFFVTQAKDSIRSIKKKDNILDFESLRSLPYVLFERVISSIIGNCYSPRFRSMKRLYTLVQDENFKKATLGGLVFIHHKTQLIIQPESRKN